MDIITLTENTAAGMGLLAEWGLSILVQVDGLNILLDTGQSTSTVYNASALGIDLSTIDKVVLSHGHSDHTGGLRQLLKATKKQVEIIAHPSIWKPKYVQRPEEDRYRLYFAWEDKEVGSSTVAYIAYDKGKEDFFDWLSEMIGKEKRYIHKELIEYFRENFSKNESIL